MILVTGATGNVGGAVIANLTAKGEGTRVLIRDQEKAQGLRDAGVEVIVGDLENAESLDAAFTGVDKVFLCTANGPNQVSQANNSIAAAKRSGRPRVVRFSGIKSAIDSEIRIGRQHAETEAALKESGLPYTIIRAQSFMQNTLMAAQTVASDGVMYMPLKDGKVAWIDVRDIGEVAAHVLTSAGHEGKTYTLTGPESISFYDVAEALSKALGKGVKYVDVPDEAARQAMLGMGLPEWLADAYGEYFKAFSEGWADVVTSDFPDLMGHPARSFEQFAGDYAQAFGGS